VRLLSIIGTALGCQVILYWQKYRRRISAVSGAAGFRKTRADPEYAVYMATVAIALHVFLDYVNILALRYVLLFLLFSFLR